MLGLGAELQVQRADGTEEEGSDCEVRFACCCHNGQDSGVFIIKLITWQRTSLKTVPRTPAVHQIQVAWPRANGRTAPLFGGETWAVRHWVQIHGELEGRGVLSLSNFFFCKS